MTPKQEIEQLRRDLERHNRLYYIDAAPEISDFEFDQRMRRLEQLEAEHPELYDPNSPTQRVGGAPIESFQTVLHDPPMLSIENAYTAEELRAWEERVRRGLGREEVEYEAELKIDGVSIALLYSEGALVRAATRGDGVRGDDVTPNARTIRNLPLRIDSSDPRLEIRGEIYIAKADFEQLNREADEAGEEPLANPRNAAAGSLRQKDPKLVARRRLSAIVYHVASAASSKIGSQTAAYELLDSLGFPTNPRRALCRDLAGVEAFIEAMREQRHALPFEIDGVVVKVNRREDQVELGVTSKAPRWVVAFKYPPEAAETVVREIRLQVGRTGAVTPVAMFDPIQLGGTTVTNASLHNFDEVARKDVRIGDTVSVEKGGDIIPKITAVNLARRPEAATPVVAPDACPVCEQPLRRSSDEVAIRCINQGCPAILRESVLHFAARKAMDIEGIGDKSVDLFIEKGLLKDYASLYELTKEQVATLDRWGEKSAEKLIEQIDRSRTAELSRLVFALGIRFVGERAAKLLAEHYGSLDALMNATAEELVQIHEIGPKVAESVVQYFSIDANRGRIGRMQALGVSPVHAMSARGGVLEGKSFVVTGTLARMSRDEIHALIEQHGGRASGSVSKKTSYLIAGEAAGSKLEKAKSLGVTVLTEDEFLAMIGERS